MSGIGLVLNTARSALAAQQLGLAVVGHNIANVSSDSYSRETLPHESRDPISFGMLRMGNGVQVQEVKRSCDQILENRLMSQKSTLTSFEEKDANLRIMEALFNEGSDSSTSGLLSEFWNAWHTLSNNPAGASERIGLADGATRFADALNYLDQELSLLNDKLTLEINNGIARVNDITKQVGLINNEISSLERTKTANDERDKRNSLMTELSELLGVSVFEEKSGAINVSTANGFSIVTSADNYELMQTDDGIKWQGSFGSQVDITDDITNGKIGGWIELRDEIIPKIKNDLDVLARNTIWEVNKQHSQGIGLDYISNSLTGNYTTDSSGLLSTLPFGDKIDYTKDFKMWFKDVSTSNPTYSSINMDMGISTAKISDWTGKAEVNHTYKFTVVNGGAVDNVADPSDPVIYWEKIKNSTGKSEGSGIINITDADTSFTVEDTLAFNISSGKLVAGNTFEINTNKDGEPDPIDIETYGTANSVSDTYKFKVTQGGTIGDDEILVSWQNRVESGTLRFKKDVSIPVIAKVDGMSLQFNSGLLFKNDEFTLTTDSNGSPDLTLPSDFKWTLSSFKDQFNRQSYGVLASESANALKFSPFTGGYKTTNFTYSDEQDGTEKNEFTSTNAKIKILNYRALTKENENFLINRDTNGLWTIQNNPSYTSAKIIPKTIEFVPDSTVPNNSATEDTYTFKVSTGGEIGTDIVVIEWTNTSGSASGTITLDPDPVTGNSPFDDIDVDGMKIDFNSGYIRKGDEFTVVTDTSGIPSVGTVPNDTGFGIDLTGDDIADMMVDFSNPATGEGSIEFDITKDTGKYNYAFSDKASEDCGIAAALGINTFFEGSDANGIKLNSNLTNVNMIAAAKVECMARPAMNSDISVKLPITIDASNNIIIFTEGNSQKLTATIKPTLSDNTYESDAEMDILASNIEQGLESASIYGLDYEVTYNSDDKKFKIDVNSDENLTIKIFWDETQETASSLGFDAIAEDYTPPDISKNGQFGTSDNTNAFNISNIQYTGYSMVQWTFKRGESTTSSSINTSLEGYYQSIIGALGVKNSAVTRGLDFNQVMVDRLSEQRDSISGVSLDEEMVNMMKFQHAYSVAAKLLTATDQMLEELIKSK
ncbi:MAG: flagellar hook-associated protein FlgK [Desulfobacterales bacterium]|nr:flagellar hook-associated protein FlgK [Desulfobacterales bacterium]